MATGVWEVNNTGTTATYKFNGVTLATLNGLKAGTIVDGGEIDGVTVNDNAGTIRISSDVLGTSKLTLNSSGYKLTLKTTGRDGVNPSEFENQKASLAAGTLTVTGDFTEGYAISSDGKSISYIAAKQNQVLAKVTGLDKALTDDDLDSYVTVDHTNGTITLTNDALDVTEGANGDHTKDKGTAVSLALSNNAVYSLVADDVTKYEPEDGANAFEEDITNGKLTISSNMQSGWTLSDDKKKLTFTAAKKILLATVNGLNADASDASIGTDVIIDEDEGTIALSKYALKTGNATLALSNGGNYVLKLTEDGIDKTTLGFGDDGNYWVVESNGAKATYKVDVKEGWTLKDSKTVTYTAAKPKTVLATLTGLKAGSNTNGEYHGTLNAGDYVNDDINESLKGITVTTPATDTEPGKITLDNRVLGTTKAAVGARENYTLAIDDREDSEYKVDTDKEEKTVWVVSGANATLLNANAVYYEVDSTGKNINYNKTAAANKDNTLVTIKGLNTKGNLEVGKGDKVNIIYGDLDDGNGGTYRGKVIEIATKADGSPELDENNNQIIILYDGAQATTNITLTNGIQNYVFELNKDGAEGGVVPAPNIDDTAGEYRFDVDADGKITLKGVLSAGFTKSSDGKTLTYVKPIVRKANRDGSDELVKIVDINGLDKTFAKKSDWYGGKAELISITSDNGSITPTQPVAVIQNTTTGEKKVIVSKDALTTGNVTVTDATYKLELAEEVPTEAKEANVWRVSGTTATYKKVKLGYYTYDATKNTIVYNKETDVETYAVVTGLASKDSDGNTITYKTDDEGGIKYVINDSDHDLATLNGTKITFKNTDALSNSVKLDTKKYPKYKLDLDDKSTLIPSVVSDGSEKWSISGTNAVLKGNMTDGWGVTDGEIKKIAAVTNGSAVLATIKNLKSGLKVVDNEIEGISKSSDTITLSNNVLDKKEVTIESTVGYALGIDTNSTDDEKVVPEPKDGSGWNVIAGSDSNSATLRQGKTAGYKVENEGKSISYSNSTYDTAEGVFVATVSGLSKNTVHNDKGEVGTLDDNGNFVKGIEVDFTNKEIKLSSSVLGNSNITVGNGYKLVLEDADSDDEIKVDEHSQVWNINGTTANLRAYETKGYSGSGTSTITYTPDKYNDTLVRVTGLKSGLSVDESGRLGVLDKRTGKFTEAVQVSDELDVDDKYTITLLDGSVEQKSDIKLSSTNDYKLKVDATPQYAETATWSVKSSSEAVYTEKGTTAGYTVLNGGQNVVYKAAKTSTTTLKGLDVSEVAGSYNSVSGIEVDRTNGKIKINDAAVGTTNVSLTSNDYLLEIGDLDKPVISSDNTNVTYTPKDGKAVLTASVAASGWGISADAKTLVYTDAGEFNMTLTGLAKNLDVDDVKFNVADANSTVDSGIRLDPSNGTITLYEDVLGATNVTVSDKNYKLAIDDNVSTLDDAGLAPEPETVWRINGTTATYKTVNPAYYTYDAAKNTIVYHKETDVKVLATITGLDKDKLAAAYTGTVTTGEIEGIDQDVDSAVITLPKSLLGASNVKITVGNYKLALADDVPTATASITEWVTNKTTATYKSYNDAYYTLASDKKTITYTKPTAGNVLAEITGIKSGVDLDEVFNEVTKTVTLTEDQLEPASSIKAAQVKLTKGAGFKIALASNVEPSKLNERSLTWSLKSATSANLVGDRSAGWAATNDSLISYTPAATSAVLTTVNGLATLGAKDDTVSGNEIGLVKDSSGAISLDANGNAIITLDGSALNSKSKVTIANAADPYLLSISSSLAPVKGATSLTTTGNGTITYQYTTTDGYTVDANKKSITYSAAKPSVEASFSGFLKNATGANASKAGAVSLVSNTGTGDIDLIALNADGLTDVSISSVVMIDPVKLKGDGSISKVGTISLTSAQAFANPSNGKITLAKNNYYNLALAESIKPQEFDSPKWYANGTTASLKQGYTDGYSISADGNTVSYVKEAPGETVAVITGLNKNLKAGTGSDAGQVGIFDKNKDFHNGVYVLSGDDNLIALNSDVLGTTNISLNSTYYKFDDQGIAKPREDNAGWYIKSGTATLKQTSYEGFTLNDDKNVFVYTPGKKDATIVTVSGLNKTPSIEGASATDSLSAIYIDDDMKVITLRNSILNAADVKTTSGDKTKTYEIELADDVATKAVNATEWVTNGMNASYKNYDRGFYSYASLKGGGDDKSALKYTKDTTGTTYATTSGLRNGATITSDDFDKATKTVKLTKEMLDGDSTLGKGKTIAIKGDAYSLDISGFDRGSVSLSGFDGEILTVANGTANYKGSITGGYMLSEDNKTLTWNNGPKANQTFFSISGLNKNTASINETSDISEDRVITLDRTDLTNSVVKLTTAQGYRLSLASGIEESKIDSLNAASYDATAKAITSKNGTAELTGAVSEGYKLTPDAKTVTYTAATAANKTVSLAKITGVTKTNTSIAGTVDQAKKTITLTGMAGNAADFTDKVTVTAADMGVKFSAYSNGSITGSANSDTITVGGSNVFISGLNGDDFITFEGHGNTFFYASGQGNDVIVNFEASDKLNINAAITAENIKVVDNDGDGEYDDAVVRLGVGSITLRDYAESNITIIDNKKTATTYVWNDGCYIEQGSNSNSYALESAELSLTPTTSLTKQSNAISYGSSIKK